MKHILCAVIACAVLSTAVGCKWLDEKPKEAQAIVDAASQTVDAVGQRLDEVEAAVKEMQQKPELSPEEQAALAKLIALKEDVSTSLAQWEGFLADAQARLDAAPTNADLIGSAVAEVATYSGIPGVGIAGALIAGWLKTRSQRNSLIQNIEAARVPADGNKIVLDHDVLKQANIASGVQAAVYSVLGKNP